MALSERFGSLIGRLRVARKLSQEKLAHLCGLHATTISEVERGKTSPALDTIEALAHGLGFEPGILITMAREPRAGAPAAYGAGVQLRFSIVAERTSTGYRAYCPDLPGCAATGSSPDDVERAMQEAITAELRNRRRAGSPIPEPGSYTAVLTITL